MQRTELVSGPFDGEVIDNMCVTVTKDGPDVLMINSSARYVGTGHRTPRGHHEAVHDALDPRLSLAAQEHQVA